MYKEILKAARLSKFGSLHKLGISFGYRKGSDDFNRKIKRYVNWVTKVLNKIGYELSIRPVDNET